MLCLLAYAQISIPYTYTVIDSRPPSGFQGHYTNKSSGTREGEATFYRTSRFRLVRKLDLSLKDCFRDILNGLEQPSAGQSQHAAAQRAARHAQFKPLLQYSPHLSQVLLHVATVAQITLLEPVKDCFSQQQCHTASQQQSYSNSSPEQLEPAQHGQQQLLNQHQDAREVVDSQHSSQQQAPSQHHALSQQLAFSEQQRTSQQQTPSQQQAMSQQQKPRQQQACSPQQALSQQAPSQQHQSSMQQATGQHLRPVDCNDHFQQQDSNSAQGSICVVNSHFFFHPHASHVRNIHAAAIMAEVKAFLDDVVQAQSMSEGSKWAKHDSAAPQHAAVPDANLQTNSLETAKSQRSGMLVESECKASQAATRKLLCVL